jgi:hypothetical protein
MGKLTLARLDVYVRLFDLVRRIHAYWLGHFDLMAVVILHDFQPPPENRFHAVLA